MLQGLSALIPENWLSAFDNLEFLIRIVLSCILGAAIGLERTRRSKEAGIRTHCIIAVSSATFMILSKYAFIDAACFEGLRTADPARIAAQVVSGISFLGAGVIFKQNTSIKGLTTAAGMWATSAVGMSIGAGMYWLGVVATATLILIQLILHRYPIAGDNMVTQTFVSACATASKRAMLLTNCCKSITQFSKKVPCLWMVIPCICSWTSACPSL